VPPRTLPGKRLPTKNIEFVGDINRDAGTERLRDR
jgi:hypothetical protein